MPDAREATLDAVRAALKRPEGQPIPEPPSLDLSYTETPIADRIAAFRAALEKLGGTVSETDSIAEARSRALELIGVRSTVCSSAPIVADCGFAPPANNLREACASAGCGITSADYALADTGSLVLFSSETEPRMVSLLPPCHIAIVPESVLLTSLEELFVREPMPADRSSAMTILTGPSRSADIEMILVRGVHGPGEVHVIFVAGR
jgi:L-lactate dehydrogenase complex protein LldG